MQRYSRLIKAALSRVVAKLQNAICVTFERRFRKEYKRSPFLNVRKLPVKPYLNSSPSLSAETITVVSPS